MVASWYNTSVLCISHFSVGAISALGLVERNGRGEVYVCNTMRHTVWGARYSVTIGLLWPTGDSPRPCATWYHKRKPTMWIFNTQTEFWQGWVPTTSRLLIFRNKGKPNRRLYRSINKVPCPANSVSLGPTGPSVKLWTSLNDMLWYGTVRYGIGG